MFGISVFLNIDQHQSNLKYIKEMRSIGAKGVFTSLHIPEEDVENYARLLGDIGKLCRELQLQLTVDISARSLEKIGFSMDRVDQLVGLGVTCLRPDFGINNQIIAKLTHHIDIALNASTIDYEDIIELKNRGANFQRLEACHNYYPRPETGLSQQFFDLKNKFLRSMGLRIMAFIPGDKQMRGPIFESLPTLEMHRRSNPFQAFLDLQQTYHIDKIYLADPGISPDSKHQFDKYLMDKVVPLRAYKTAVDLPLIGKKHTNRMDPGSFAIRSQESRLDLKDVTVEAQAIKERKKGAITLDNYMYQRYQGELQIIVKTLPADKRVNVIGQIVEQDLALLDLIGPGQGFEIEWEGGR
ncbi:DUF871 domain-containing protein [Facklamia miroungae]|uniref:Outer surface protein n=1 Tax=Facklamia miroungae TaxID=120956 RepID=A0A1G7QPV3_9LACT|nr:MupG family TIM beta-alpha barrel fold protein [Facklamia miroungae]NKZ29023.1 DUF871 domain-containing protein [Facklamia miroungae]SDG00538.1 hypothetical protein SAMN05421791_102174 [Facklamia miroungae]